MGLILGLGAAAALALAFWRALTRQDATMASLEEYRRTTGIVNAVSYAFSLVLDAMSMRRQAQLSTAPASPLSGPRRVTPLSIGQLAADIHD